MTIAVLAGGCGRRMGGAKATALLAGRPLLHHVVEAARATGRPVVVVAKADSALPPLTVPVWREPDAPRHPLVGVAHALRRAGGPVVFVPLDLPFVSPELVDLVARRPEPLVVVAYAGRWHPLLGRSAPGHAEALERDARHGTPVADALRALGAVATTDAELRRVGDPDRLLLNVNDASDLAGAQRLAAPQPSAEPD